MTYTLKIVYPHHHFHPPNKKKYQLPSDPSDFIERAELKLLDNMIKRTYALWDYLTNNNEENEKKSNKFREMKMKLELKLAKEAKAFDMNKKYNYDIKRKLNMLKDKVGNAVLSGDKLKKVIELSNKMNLIFGESKVDISCIYAMQI